MVWYCVEERNEPISKYGRYRRRFLDGSKFSIFSNLGKDRLVIRQVKNRSWVHQIFVGVWSKKIMFSNDELHIILINIGISKYNLTKFSLLVIPIKQLS